MYVAGKQHTSLVTCACLPLALRVSLAAMQRLVLLVGFSVLLLFPAVSGAAAQAPLERISVVLDPGHGGDDWGVDPAGSGLREKEVVLEIVERIRQQLEERGAAVYVTRTTDRFVSLGARVRFANALLFRPDNDASHGRLLSIHLNSNRQNPTLRRVEVLVDPWSDVAPLAVEMANALEQATGGGFGYHDAGYPSGVHPGDLAPVRWTYPRGHNVLTESAFLSNPAQASELRNAAFLERVARAHVLALQRTLASANQ